MTVSFVAANKVTSKVWNYFILLRGKMPGPFPWMSEDIVEGDASFCNNFGGFGRKEIILLRDKVRPIELVFERVTCLTFETKLRKTKLKA